MKAIEKIALLVQLAAALAFFAWTSKAQDVRSEAVSDFKWFSSLGFPDIKGCPYVRVATGRWSQMGDEPRRNQYVNGFLLATNGPVFRVLTTKLSDQAFTNEFDGTNEYKRVGFDTLDLNTEAQRLLESLENLPAKEDPWRNFGSPLTQRTETFIIAWACWQQGLDAMADQLYEQAQKLPPRREENGTTNSFRESIEKDLAYAMIWHAVVCFGDPSISRPQLLVLFNSIATNYPHSQYHERAAQTAEMLRKMIAEDEAHAKTPVTKLDQLPLGTRVQELIFRLRDQNGHQYSQPGSCDIFDDWGGHNNTNTPAHQLVRLGYAAVPQLIAALDDQAFTRSVGFWRDFVFSHTVLTVGDCSAAILQRITGKSFVVPSSTSSYMSKDGKVSATRRAAEAWWAEFQKKGEKQMLIDAVSAPSEDAPAQADILCQKYPDVAVQTLARGIQATTDEWIRTRLVRRIGYVDDPRVAGFLNAEMTNSPVLMSRVEAADQLHRLKKGEPIGAMMQEWAKLKGQKFTSGDAGERVIQFLANSDSPEAIGALGSRIRQCPVETRLDIVEAVGGESYWSDSSLTNSPGTWAAIEELLVKELEDTEERSGMSGSINGKSFNDPRICDVAGELLAEHWTKQFAFDISASFRVRNRERVQCINVWRKAHALPLLPVPPVRSIHVKPDQATLVTAIEWMDDSVKSSDEFAKSVDAFKGRPLDTARILSLLTHYAGDPEPQSVGLQCKAIKDEDLTGVTLLVRLMPGQKPEQSKTYSVDERVTLGRRSLLRSVGAGGGDYYSKTNGWSDFADAVAQVIAGKPEIPFEISVQIVSQNVQ